MAQDIIGDITRLWSDINPVAGYTLSLIHI